MRRLVAFSPPLACRLPMFSAAFRSYSDEPEFHFDTLCIHGGKFVDPFTGSVNVPISLSSTFRMNWNEQEQEMERFPAGAMYTRSNNPSRSALEAQIASLEGADYATIASSGMAATSNVVMLLRAGDHMICMDDVYGGTRALLEDIVSQLSVDVDFLDLSDPSVDVASYLRPETKLIWVETPTNPTLKIVDIESLASTAHAYDSDILVAVDNTFATPYLQRPLDLGADIAMHSATKYLNGHADLLMGAVAVQDEELQERIWVNHKTLGGTSSPFDCYMCGRGLKTLGLRVRTASENAMRVATMLDSHPKVERVIYPGLDSHPQHELAKRQMSGPNGKHFGGMVTFYLKNEELSASAQFLASLKVFALAVSLGGVESLAEHPALMTHDNVPYETRMELGLTDNLVRLSVGVEYVEDLLWDLEQALENV